MTTQQPTILLLEIDKAISPYRKSAEFSISLAAFAAKKGGKKNCKKGYACGMSCISTTKNRRNPLSGQSGSFQEWLGTHGGNAGGSDTTSGRGGGSSQPKGDNNSPEEPKANDDDDLDEWEEETHTSTSWLDKYKAGPEDIKGFFSEGESASIDEKKEGGTKPDTSWRGLAEPGAESDFDEDDFDFGFDEDFPIDDGIKGGNGLPGQSELENSDRYTEIGRGGYGAVYLDEEAGTVLKVGALKSDIGNDVKGTKLANSLGLGPKLIRVSGNRSEGVMELERVPGSSIAKSSLTKEQSREALEELIGQVSTLHNAGYFHGDLGGPNVMVDTSGEKTKVGMVDMGVSSG